MWIRTLILSALLVASASAAPVVLRVQAVQPNWVMPTQSRGESNQQIRSLREIVDMVRARYGGELIGARLEDGPRPFYVLRWRMPDNQVRDFRVDAVSGQIR